MEINKWDMEINKWDMEINKLIKHKYKHDFEITDIIKVIWTEKGQYKDITFTKCKICNNQLYY